MASVDQGASQYAFGTPEGLRPNGRPQEPFQTPSVGFYRADQRTAVGADDIGLVAVGPTGSPGFRTSQPVFGGVTMVNATPGDSGSPGRLDVYWDYASDAVTAKNNLRYRVYLGTSLPLDYLYPNGETNGTQNAMSVQGYVGALNYVGVRAVNEFDVEDTNTVTIAISPNANTSPPYFQGLTAGGRIPGTDEAEVAWARATSTDPNEDINSIEIRIWVAETPGGQNFAGPPNYTPSNDYDHETLTGLDSDKDYFVVARARDSNGNESTNTEEIWLPKAAANPDIVPPAATDFDPMPGTPIGKQQVVSFSVTDDAALRRVIVTVKLAGTEEVVHDGDGFVGAYSLGSSAVALPLGRRYNVRRTGGWTSAPTFKVYAFDAAGNEA